MPDRLSFMPNRIMNKYSQENIEQPSGLGIERKWTIEQPSDLEIERKRNIGQLSGLVIKIGQTIGQLSGLGIKRKQNIKQSEDLGNKIAKTRYMPEVKTTPLTLTKIIDSARGPVMVFKDPNGYDENTQSTQLMEEIAYHRSSGYDFPIIDISEIRLSSLTLSSLNQISFQGEKQRLIANEKVRLVLIVTGLEKVYDIEYVNPII